SGALNKEGETVLKQMIRFASKVRDHARAALLLCSSSFRSANSQSRLCRLVQSRTFLINSCSSDEPSMTSLFFFFLLCHFFLIKSCLLVLHLSKSLCELKDQHFFLSGVSASSVSLCVVRWRHNGLRIGYSSSLTQGSSLPNWRSWKFLCR